MRYFLGINRIHLVTPSNPMENYAAVRARFKTKSEHGDQSDMGTSTHIISLKDLELLPSKHSFPRPLQSTAVEIISCQRELAYNWFNINYLHIE